jgi:hypothetical protein
MMRSGLWRAGDVAKQTGVSVRTLHWYEEIGMLAPSQRSEAGHRLYGPEDLGRLQQSGRCGNSDSRSTKSASVSANGSFHRRR